MGTMGMQQTLTSVFGTATTTKSGLSVTERLAFGSAGRALMSLACWETKSHGASKLGFLQAGVFAPIECRAALCSNTVNNMPDAVFKGTFLDGWVLVCESSTFLDARHREAVGRVCVTADCETQCKQIASTSTIWRLRQTICSSLLCGACRLCPHFSPKNWLLRVQVSAKTFLHVLDSEKPTLMQWPALQLSAPVGFRMQGFLALGPEVICTKHSRRAGFLARLRGKISPSNK